MWLLDFDNQLHLCCTLVLVSRARVDKHRYKLKGRIDISTVFDMDQLGKIRRLHWKERPELVTFAKFKSDTS